MTSIEREMNRYLSRRLGMLIENSETEDTPPDDHGIHVSQAMIAAGAAVICEDNWDVAFSCPVFFPKTTARDVFVAMVLASRREDETGGYGS